jgi:hypothetical protein
MKKIVFRMHTLALMASLWLVSGCSGGTAGPNRAPVAVAGPDRVAAVQETVVLNASGSYDPDGDTITYQWTLVAAPGEAALSAERAVSTELVPDVTGVWVVRLEVSDGRLKSQPDVVQVRVTGGPPCITDQQCDDGEYCNGAESCVDGYCEPGTPPDCSDGDVCTRDECNEDLDRCENPAVTEPPGTEGPVGDATCTDGADNDCDGMTDGEDTGCIVCSSDADCDDHNECTDDSCQGQACVHDPVAEGTVCDDGLWCTDDGSGGGDVCVAGRCVGQVERDCSAAGDDQCNGFACDEQADACVAVPVDDGTECDDGQWCTEDDECTGGVCAGAQRDCSAESRECVEGVCNEDLDRCEGRPMADDEPCDDGEYCTVGETCLSGDCQGGGPRDCTEVADQCNDEACNDQVDACQPIPKTDGTECGTRSCNGLDWMRQTCESGSCTGSDLVLGCDDGRDCTDDACDPAAGCSHTPLADGAECGARYCDGLEHRRQTCLSGVCSGSELLSNCDDANDCTADTCDGTTGCGNTNLADGSECGSRYCSGLEWRRETCQSGQCTADALQDNCDDSNVCTDDACDPLGGCTNTNNTDGCDDGNACTMNDACANGSCTGEPLDADGDTHIATGCPNGDDCDDGDPDIHPGVFEGSYGDPICGDGADNDCDGLTDTADRGCQECQTNSDCDDSNVCNGVETCVGVACQPGTPLTCDNGVYCDGLETCDPASGCQTATNPCPETECKHCNEDANNCFDPVGTACSDDGEYCTGVEQCDGAGTCASSGNPCEPESECKHCNEVDGNCFDSSGTACTDDNKYCTGVEQCDGAGLCVSSGNPCEPESECKRCNEATNRCFDPDGTPCTDDLVFCNGVEECDGAGNCVSSGEDPCPGSECKTCQEDTDSCFDPEGAYCGSNSDTACTDRDTCDGAGNCQDNHAPPDTPCDDGKFCTGTDTCDGAGVCDNHTGDPCLGGDECNAYCNEDTNDCYDPNGTFCGDPTDDDCTDRDTCDGAGTCQDNHASVGAPCDDGRYCTITDTCNGLGECLGAGDPCAPEETCLEGTDTYICVTCQSDEECPKCQYCNAGNCENQPPGEDYKNECQHTQCATGDCDGAGDCEYEPPTTSCGNSSESDCDHADHCDGAGTCDPNYAPEDDPCGDQGVDCHVDDTCDGAGSCDDNGLESEGTLCGSSNEDECDHQDTCDDSGNCLDNYEPKNAPCGDQGVDCHVDDTCDGAGSCDDNGLEDPGTPCTTDGLYCNGVEECDASGACIHPGDPCTLPEICDEDSDACVLPVCADDGDCPSGDICWPSCSLRPDGCLTPPTSLTLSCTDPVNLSLTYESNCTITLSGGDSTGQAGCLTCTAEVGVTTVDVTDFSDAGACDLDGWSLVSGNNCSDHGDNCELGGAPKTCCSDFGVICDDTTFGQPVARADKRNCDEQVRLYKTFDLSGLDKAWVCFDIADNAADGNDSIQLYVDAAANPGADWEQIFCQDGPPQDQVNDFFYNYCVELPVWAQGQPDVTLTFVVHSNDNDDVMFLDNIVLRGWGGGCPEDIILTGVLNEDFNDPSECDTTGWSFSNNDWDCPGFSCNNEPGWSPGIEADREAFDMETSVDASELDGEVTVCFQLGYDDIISSDWLILEFDAGSGWTEAWRQDGQMGPNDECRLICVNLSDVDPAVNNNPALGIRFRFHSDGSSGGEIIVYGVTVTGARYCPVGPSVVAVSSPPSDDGGGNYGFTATDTHGQQLDANITCHWDPDASLNGSFTVHYRNQSARFTKRRQLTFDNSSRGENLQNFPVLVVLDSAWFDYTSTQDAGEDLRFFDDDGSTRLPHEIEEWNESGSSYVWVKVPQIDANSDTDFIWMVYGNPAAEDDQEPRDVWTAGYVAVWHLNETGAVYSDSTGNGNDGAQSGNSSAGGIIAGAQYFDGSNDHIEVSNAGLQISGDEITIEAWARPTGEPVDYCHVIGAGRNNDGRYWQLWWDALSYNGWHGRLRVNGDDAGIYTYDGAYNDWNYLALLYDGSERRLYWDATEIGSEGGSGNLDTITTALWIGDNPEMYYRDFEGYIDEVRISNVYRTDDWLDAQHFSMRDWLITFGSEEDL